MTVETKNDDRIPVPSSSEFTQKARVSPAYDNNDNENEREEREVLCSIPAILPGIFPAAKIVMIVMVAAKSLTLR